MDDAVYAEIIRRRLYNAAPEFEWLRERAYRMLNPARVPHVRGCEEEAERLAVRWGADVGKAREAAILHDITKKDQLKAQREICEKYNVKLDKMEREEVKLLHAKTGAAIAKYEFGCDDEVVGAINWHTTGREDMTLLEKIMYMADYIEPNRSFDGVDRLRKAAYEDIDLALYLGFSMSVEDMQRRGVRLHDRTTGALRWITEKIKDKDNT